MFVVDYLILNRDRHGANIEVLRNKKERTIRLAPLFDHGISLLFNCRNDKEVNEYDILADKPVNSFLGYRSVKENLNLIPKDKLPRLNILKETDKEILFEDIEDIFSETMINKIWDMVYTRWRCYEDFCKKRK